MVYASTITRGPAACFRLRQRNRRADHRPGRRAVLPRRAHERGVCENRRANHRMARTTATMASVSLTPPAATYR